MLSFEGMRSGKGVQQIYRLTFSAVKLLFFVICYVCFMQNYSYTFMKFSWNEYL